jgi:hypothetical protein
MNRLKMQKMPGGKWKALPQKRGAILCVEATASMCLSIDREAFEKMTPGQQATCVAEEFRDYLGVMFEQGGDEEIARSALDSFTVIDEHD